LGGIFVPTLDPGRQVTHTEVIDAQPDIIIVAWAGVAKAPSLEKIYARPGWDAIPAIQHRRVYAVEEIHLNAPGPNLIEGARQLAQVMYQQSFALPEPVWLLASPSLLSNLTLSELTSPTPQEEEPSSSK
jgi:ABC-type Fe3+-hydroxamate transport system substrate-binding protein